MNDLVGKVEAKQKVFTAKKEAWEAKMNELKDADANAKEAIEAAINTAKEEMDAEEMGLKDFQDELEPLKKAKKARED